MMEPVFHAGVAVLPSFASAADCLALLGSALQQGKWRPARVGEYEFGRLVDAKEDARATTAEVTQSFDTSLEILNRLRHVATQIARQELGVVVRRLSNIGISRYGIGTAVGRHRDTETLTTHRLVTIILYLNDDYAGGRLEFPDLGISYQPRMGDLLVFLSEHFHSVSPVIEGVRYCAILFGENEGHLCI
jgi:predicted 2-oxoglutarate/Fe(II)-dependent dioxygenase YbiX